MINYSLTFVYNIYIKENPQKQCGNQNLIVIKTAEVEEILKEIHDNSGHQNARYTYNQWCFLEVSQKVSQKNI